MRQHEIEDEHIRAVLARGRQHSGCFGDPGDTLHIRLGVDELAHDLAEVGVIFRDQDSQRIGLQN